jgi:hypothetical protein
MVLCALSAAVTRCLRTTPASPSLIGHRENKIVIRSHDMIVAEHLPLPKRAPPSPIPCTWKPCGSSFRNTKILRNAGPISRRP